MAENMMNSDHKASTEKSRSNHEKIFGPDPRDPTEENIERCGPCERGYCERCDIRGWDLCEPLGDDLKDGEER